jgi:hypothetical protein
MNLTNYSFNFTGTGTVEVNAYDVIRDFVMQIDDKIILAITLLFVSYFLAYLILPRSIKGVDELRTFFKNRFFDVFFQSFKSICKMLISLFETIGLGCAIFIFAIAYIQGIIPKTYIYIVYSLLFLLFLILMAEVVSIVRQKKYAVWLKKRGLRDG